MPPEPAQQKLNGLNPKKKQAILIMLTSITLAVFALVLLFIQLKFLKVPSENQNLSATTTDSIGSLQADEFADWQMYRNDEYGFEFRYPPEYFAQNSDRDSITVTTIGKKELQFEGDEKAPIEIDQTSIENLERDRLNIIENYEESVIIINGKEALKISGKLSPNYFGWGGTNHTFIYLPKSNPILRLEYDAEDKEIKNIFNQILSTFRFTEQISETNPNATILNQEKDFWASNMGDQVAFNFGAVPDGTKKLVILKSKDNKSWTVIVNINYTDDLHQPLVDSSSNVIGYYYKMQAMDKNSYIIKEWGSLFVPKFIE